MFTTAKKKVRTVLPALRCHRRIKCVLSVCQVTNAALERERAKRYQELADRSERYCVLVLRMLPAARALAPCRKIELKKVSDKLQTQQKLMVTASAQHLQAVPASSAGACVFGVQGKGRRKKIAKLDKFGEEIPEETVYKWKLERKT